MKFPIKFSIGVWLTLIAMVAGFLAGYRDQFRISPEFEGKWRIVSAINNGVDCPLAIDPDGSLSNGECAEIELILVENRLVLVKTNGDSIVGETRKVNNSPAFKLEVTTPVSYYGNKRPRKSSFA